jgi:hypothetical protein
MDGEINRMKKKRAMASISLGSARTPTRLRRSKQLHKSKIKPIRNKIAAPRVSSLPDDAAAVREGAAWRVSNSSDRTPERLRAAIHQCFSSRYRDRGRNAKLDWKLVMQRGKKYAADFMRGAGVYATVTPVPLQNKAAAVLYVGPGNTALHKVLSQLQSLPLHEIVLIMTHSTDEKFTLARSLPNTVIAHLPEEVDPDVGRALGAKLTSADTVLFVDGEHAVDASNLARFLWECDRRVDVALNNLSPHYGLFHQRGGVELFHEFLNMSLNRDDLRMNSMSVLPYAVSRRALDTLGAVVLSVPVKAHALAILKGLRIGLADSVAVRIPQYDTNSGDNWKKTAGDHVEAWREAMSVRGNRLHFADSNRNRRILGDWER